MQVTPRRAKALGHPGVWIGSRRISKKAWSSRRALELFFLLMNHPAGLTKERIVRALFPDSDEGSSDGLFHSTLYRCRRALGRDEIVWEDDIYRIHDISSWGYDVLEFESMVRRGRREELGGVGAERLYRRALQLYEGDYLEGWASEWCEPPRLRLRHLYVEAALGVARYCAGRGQPEKALEFYRLAIAKDYYSEPGHKGIADSLLAVGDRLGAVRHYLDLVERLKQDVPVEERSEIQGLVEDMLGRSLHDLLSDSKAKEAARPEAVRHARSVGDRHFMKEQL